VACRAAPALATNAAERAFLDARLAALGGKAARQGC
jgi:hypothetical protein